MRQIQRKYDRSSFGASVAQNIEATWINSFTGRFRIVTCAHTGKHKSSPKKQGETEVSVAAHLRTLCRVFGNGMNDADLSNADETHFVINVDNGCTLGVAGETEDRYAGVVSGGDGLTMMRSVSWWRTGVD